MTNREVDLTAPGSSPLVANPFYGIVLSDDEEDEEEIKEGEDHEIMKQKDEDEAGDVPLHFLSVDVKPFVPQELETLRLLIRLYVSQADL